MRLPAPFGYEEVKKIIKTLGGQKIEVTTKKIPFKEPHEYFEILLPTSQTLVCGTCGLGKFDDMHNPMLWDPSLAQGF